MTRVKGGTVAKNRRRKVLKEAKGYFGSKHRLYKTAQEQLVENMLIVIERLIKETFVNFGLQELMQLAV